MLSIGQKSLWTRVDAGTTLFLCASWRGVSQSVQILNPAKTSASALKAHTRHTTPPTLPAIMADPQPPAGAPAVESSENLHTDPVTGEKISKSELKRRQKQREKDEKKKEKEAALPARPKKEGAGKKEDVEELNPNVRVQGFNTGSSCANAVCSNTSRSGPRRSTPFVLSTSPKRIPTSSTSTRD